MKGPGGALLLAFLVATTGCVAGGGGGNKNILSPKLLVDHTPDGDTILYVHAAFTDATLYDRIHVRVDNATVNDARHVFAWTHKTNATSLFLDVRVDEADGDDERPDRFRYAAHIAMDPWEGRVTVTPWEDGAPGDPDDHGLPYHKVIPKHTPEDA